MENRFLEIDAVLKQARQRPRQEARRATTATAASRSAAMSSGYALSFSADQRALVILIENGGIDLGIPELADKLLDALPGSSMIPDGARQKLISFLRDEIKSLTDNLLESAELAVNRYGAASPEFFGSVTVLRNSTASYDDLRNKLFSLSKDGKLVDLLILTHGSDNEIAVNGGITGEKIRKMRADFGKPLSIRSVYMMNCVGSSLNQAWLDAGAKVSSGALHNNYLPEPTTFFFWQNWKAGQGFEQAVTSAYRKTVSVMNDAVQGFAATLGGPVAGFLAGKIDFADMDFVKDSAPVIQGQRTVTIGTDDLAFTQTISSSLATTVLPVNQLRWLAGAGSRDGGPILRHSSTYNSPSTTMSVPGRLSVMQNPVAAVIAGIEVADAIQIGLAGAAMVQTAVNGSSGSFQLVYDKAARLLTPEARAKMPGSQTSKSTYTRQLLYIGSSGPGIDWAQANVIIVWEGNPYGEIGTPVVRRDLKTSTDWSKSSASVTVTRLDTIPMAGGDPRTWPIVYHYEGNYDPVGNGYFEFSGEFEINAFGGLKFNRHEVVSRSLVDFAISGKPEDYVQKGQDVVAAVPTIPDEQVKYLKSNLPN